ncbi:MAG: amidohydrolase family protein [Candidatus Anammoximicrobium sp.]|mgnify:CR=1 FL=1|nr:amidohydrolase family protein [Candidatus Anammoximicrobium sp.]
MLIRTLQAAAGVAAASRLPQRLATAGSEPAERSVWDAHVHLTGVAGSVEQRVDGLLKIASRVGIERLIFCMGTSFVPDPSPAELRKQNDEVLRAIAHAPDRVSGMVYVNPKQKQASLDEMDRCVREGPMVGVKLWIALECSRPELDPIVRRAVELKVPLLQHAYDRTAENLPGESSCGDVAILAARHPDARFICAHTGNDWERGIRTIRNVQNVWAEVCGSDPTAGFVEMAVRELGAERVVYGSDGGGRSFASQLAKVYSAGLPAADQRLILGGNIRRLLARVPG